MKIKIGKYMKILAMLLFLGSIYLVVVGSKIPLIIDWSVFDSIFVPKKPVDDAILGIVTGYFTGYLVYLLTVVIPGKEKQKIFMRNACQKIYALYVDSMYVLLLAGKSAASITDWQLILNKKTDKEVCDKEFCQIMENFDISQKAETFLKDKDTYKTLSWSVYWEEKSQSVYEDLENLIIKYHMYLSDELLECIYKWKNSLFFGLMLGNSERGVTYWENEDNEGFYENIPLFMFCNQAKGKVNPIFGAENKKILVEYLEILLKSFDLCSSYVETNPSVCLDYVKRDNVGHIGSSRMAITNNIHKNDK